MAINQNGATKIVSCDHYSGKIFPSFILLLTPSDLALSAGSNAPSSPLSTTHPVRDATVPASPPDKSLPPPTRLLEAPPESNYTDVPVVPATKGFPDIPMSGPCLKPEEDEPVNSPTASVCCVELPVPKSDGYGIVRTMSGPRSTVNIKGDGSTSTLVRRCGIIQEPTPKVSITPRLEITPC